MNSTITIIRDQTMIVIFVSSIIQTCLLTCDDRINRSKSACLNTRTTYNTLHNTMLNSMINSSNCCSSVYSDSQFEKLSPLYQVPEMKYARNETPNVSCQNTFGMKHIENKVVDHHFSKWKRWWIPRRDIVFRSPHSLDGYSAAVKNVQPSRRSSSHILPTRTTRNYFFWPVSLR